MEDKVTSSGRPIQLLSWKEKIKDNGKWFIQNCEYALSRSSFTDRARSIAVEGSGTRDLQLLYEIYNNKFPMAWFSHIIDPLSASNPSHKVFPAKIRPVSILRTNLDLLLAEYPRRPFIYQVNNLADSGYSDYQQQLSDTLKRNLTEHFEQMLTLKMMDQGLIQEDGQPASEEAAKQVQQQLEQLELPQDIKTKFFSSYKDNIAVKGQTWLRRTIQEHFVKSKLLKGFKHWLITGEVYSYKTVEFGNILYEIVSPQDISYILSKDNDFIEDAEMVVRRLNQTRSDIVDRYYPELTKDNMLTLDNPGLTSSATNFFNYINTFSGATLDTMDVYHVTWKGKKEILFVANMETGEQYEVDEDYVVDPNIEKITDRIYVNELYECTKIGDIYINKRPVLFQRNAMNNFSVCKQPYNGRRFSNLESENIGPLEIGIPYQILYIIVTRTLELTIAKSKGKIFVVDQNAIPNNEEWDEEKVFYYAEALGYFLINRDQIGVDKSFNQYQVFDMSLFDSIKQLIELQQHFKQEWDDVLGINRQRKGQTYASDAVANNERATFQSTVITDMIFNLYEEFVEKELQGLLDLSKFTNIDGVRKIWNDTEFGNQLLEIDPVQYANAELGIFVQSSSEALQILKAMQNDAQAMLQNGAKPSTVLEVRKSMNVAELTAKLKEIEAAQAQAEQAIAENDQEAERLADERRKEFMAYENTLKEMFMNKEYDRKEEIELIRAEANMYTFKAADESAPNGVPDILELEKHRLDRKKHEDTISQKALDRTAKLYSDAENRKLKREELSSKERIARSKPKPKK